jgi:hypothetical protein
VSELLARSPKKNKAAGTFNLDRKVVWADISPSQRNRNSPSCHNKCHWKERKGWASQCFEFNNCCRVKFYIYRYWEEGKGQSKSTKISICHAKISQDTAAAKKASNADSSKASSSAAAAGSGSDIVGQLESELSSLGLNLGGLRLRSIPVLEARKKKNGTAVAGVAAVSKIHLHSIKFKDIQLCRLRRLTELSGFWNCDGRQEGR